MKVFRFDKSHLSFCNQSLKKKFQLRNNFRVPKVERVIISISTKDAISDAKVVKKIYDDLFLISGQMPIITQAKKSIASFKLRKDMRIGVKVTLRREIMYNFLRKLINIALPRVRDFKGFSAKQFDGHGNFSLGIKEQIIFPEIDYNMIDKIRGLGIVVITTTDINMEAKFLLECLGFPFYN